MDKDNLPEPAKHKIWPSWKIVIMLSVMQSQLSDPQFNDLLRSGPECLDGAHVLATLFHRKPVLARGANNSLAARPHSSFRIAVSYTPSGGRLVGEVNATAI
jgi:hypothetical protein